MFKINIFILILFLSLTSMAEIKVGGLFLEPGLTYENGSLNLRYPAPVLSDSNENIKGYGFGLRVGGHFADILFLAGDIRYSQPNYESSALNGSSSSQAVNYGVTLGLQTPILGLRVWNTFILDGKLDPGSISNVDVEYTGFNGYRIGGGLYIAFISLNLEYQEAKYKGTNVKNSGAFAAGALDNVNGTEKSYILSVSFPIAL